MTQARAGQSNPEPGPIQRNPLRVVFKNVTVRTNFTRTTGGYWELAAMVPLVVPCICYTLYTEGSIVRLQVTFLSHLTCQLISCCKSHLYGAKEACTQSSQGIRQQIQLGRA